MKRQVFSRLVVVCTITLLWLVLAIGCGGSDGDTTDGDAPDGDVSDGDTSDGDEPDGDVTDGDSDGDEPDGDITDGDIIDGDEDGDVVDGDEDGDVVDGDEDGDVVDGDVPDGDVVDGDVVDGDTSDGDIIDGDEDGDVVDGDASDGDVVDGDEDGDVVDGDEDGDVVDGDEDGDVEVDADAEIDGDLDAEEESDVEDEADVEEEVEAEEEVQLLLALSASRDLIDFGSQPANASRLSQTVRLTNTGEADLTLSKPESNPDGLTVEFEFETSLELKPEESTVVTVRWNPADGTIDAALEFSYASATSETLNESVAVQAESVDPTRSFSGIVLELSTAPDGSSIERPLAGAQVAFDGVAQAVTSDENGRFVFANIAASPDQRKISARISDEYSAFSKTISLSQSTSIRIKMQKLQAEPLQLAEEEASYPVDGWDGASFVLDPSNIAPSKSFKNNSLTAGTLDLGAMPTAFDGGIPLQLMYILPFGVDFVEPIPLTIPNEWGLSGDDRVSVWLLPADDGGEAYWHFVGFMELDVAGEYWSTAAGEGIGQSGFILFALEADQTYTVSGRVLMPDGSTPAPDATVMKLPEPVQYATTGDDGRFSFSFESRPGAIVQLQAFSGSVVSEYPTYLTVTLGEDAAVELEDMVLIGETFGMIEGQVSYEDDQLCVDCPVMVISAAGNTRYGMTDENGVFSFPEVAEGEALVKAFSPVTSNDVSELVNVVAYQWSRVSLVLPLDDTTPPVLLAAMPGNGQTRVHAATKLRAIFSEAMDPATLVASSVVLRLGTVSVPLSVATEGDNVLVATPGNPLELGRSYEFELTTALKDLAGNPLPLARIIRFRTTEPGECVNHPAWPCIIEFFNWDTGRCEVGYSNNTCDDGNACTMGDTCSMGACNPGVEKRCPSPGQCYENGFCDPDSGQCVNPPKPDNTLCEDGEFCTVNETCQQGVCTGGEQRDCFDVLPLQDEQCLVAVCDEFVNACVPDSVDNGQRCDDDDLCTLADSCQDGACMGIARDCQAKDQCHDAGSCNPETGLCSDPAVENGTLCDDGNANSTGDRCEGGVCLGIECSCSGVNECCDGCLPRNSGGSCDDGNGCTLGDSCQAGFCVGGEPKQCEAMDQCHKAGICLPETGECTNPIQPGGTLCDDSNLCTDNDICVAGACRGAAVQCVAQDQCHYAGVCDPSSGVCTSPSKPNGAACADGNLCTTGDVCTDGVCGGQQKQCPAGDACHEEGSCNPVTGACVNAPVENGTPCDDRNACSQTDVCVEGQCVGGNAVVCDALDDCHDVGACNIWTGSCSAPKLPDGTVCDDGNVNTGNDSCQGGSCIGEGCTCTGVNACCDGCLPRDGSQGATCDDGNACTQVDSCQAGYCIGADPVSCTASDSCHFAGSCNPATGLCSDPVKPDGFGCTDDNLCTVSDTCRAGVCVGQEKSCTRQDQCHDVGQCNPDTGVCSNPIVNDGTACNDSNLCTVADACVAGVCTGSPKQCYALDQCHVAGTCSPVNGQCSQPLKADGSRCDDGSACTGEDQCLAGACEGVTLECPALDQCHREGFCDEDMGSCVSVPRADGALCDDGNPETTYDYCQQGVCVGVVGGCASDVDCGEGFTCNDGTCVVAPLGHCESGCNPFNRPCEAGLICADYENGLGEWNTVCLTPCTEQSDCPEQTGCFIEEGDDQGVCYPDVESMECVDNQLVAYHVCGATAENGGSLWRDCDKMPPCMTATCDAEAQTCVEEQLPNDAACEIEAGSGFCKDGFCDVPCDSDVDCAEGFWCFDGMCVDQTFDPCEGMQCGMNSYCYGGQCYCVDGFIGDPYFQCVPFVACQLDEECAEGMLCMDGVCMPDYNHCTVDDDCFHGDCETAVCAEGMCEYFPLEDQTACNNEFGEGACLQGKCEVACELDDDCGSDPATICMDGFCKWDGPDPCAGVVCGDFAYCMDGGCVCQPGYSGDPYSMCQPDETCTLDEDCNHGECQVGACVEGLCEYTPVADQTVCNMPLGEGVCIAGMCELPCTVDEDCSTDGSAVCMDGFCKWDGPDPCAGVVCGDFAYCMDGGCACEPGYVGDPYTACKLPDETCEFDEDCNHGECQVGACVEGLCEYTPVAEQTVCNMPLGEGVCIAGMCELPCAVDEDCSTDGSAVCMDGFCKWDGPDPCAGVICGEFAYCMDGGCQCEPGYVGDPYTSCKLPDETCEFDEDCNHGECQVGACVEGMCEYTPVDDQTVCNMPLGEGVCIAGMCELPCTVDEDCSTDGSAVCMDGFCKWDGPDPCEGVVCGDFAYCMDGGCACEPGYEGDPYSACQPEVQSCTTDEECFRSDCEIGTCVGGACEFTAQPDGEPCAGGQGQCWGGVCDYQPDPCESMICGANALCAGGQCYCPGGYQGDPWVECLAWGQNCLEDAECADGACVIGTCSPDTQTCVYDQPIEDWTICLGGEGQCFDGRCERGPRCGPEFGECPTKPCLAVVCNSLGVCEGTPLDGGTVCSSEAGEGSCFDGECEVSCVEDLDCSGEFICIEGYCERPPLGACELGCGERKCDDGLLCAWLDGDPDVLDVCLVSCANGETCPEGSTCQQSDSGMLCMPDLVTDVCDGLNYMGTDTCGLTRRVAYCDDGNMCTIDGCSDGGVGCTHDAVADQTDCTNEFGNGACIRSKCEVPCTVDDDCGLDSMSVCMDGTCGWYEPDPCENVICGMNAHCEQGGCFCDPGFVGDPWNECMVDPCTDVVCGANAHCDNGSCYCDLGHSGDPLSECTQDSCVLDEDCVAPDCMVGTCVNEFCEFVPAVDGDSCADGMGQCWNGMCDYHPDPCAGVICGEFAYCMDGGCQCEPGYEGDPYTACKLPDETCEFDEDCNHGECQVGACVDGACEFTPVADQTVCNMPLGEGVCIAGMCEMPCTVDEDCSTDGSAVCMDGFCKWDGPDPCEGVVCGDLAYCMGGGCVCQPGYEGDPYSACQPEVQSCTTDEECFRSDCEIGTCVGGACEFTAQPDGEPCAGGQGQCWGGVCDYQPDPCAGVVCGDFAYCMDGGCVCQPGYSGDPYSMCQPDETCTLDEDCNHGECQVGACVEGLCEYTPVAEQTVCNMPLGEGVCIAGMCELPCTVDEDCSTDGSAVCMDGFCKWDGPDPCAGVICGDFAYCMDGGCVCEPGYSGDPYSMCQPAVQGCEFDEDCTGGDACKLGKCDLEKGQCEYFPEVDGEACQTKDGIAGLCLQGDCSDYFYCSVDGDCQALGFECAMGTCNLDSFQCEWSFVAVDTACAEGAGVCNGNGACHVACQDDPDCNSDEECVDGLCRPLPPDPCMDVVCGMNAHCEQGDCMCDPGFVGDPFSACQYDDCAGVACGTNAYCSAGQCFCESGYVGDPYGDCLPETGDGMHCDPDCSLSGCADGNHCLFYGDSGASVCMQDCTTNGVCPEGSSCVDMSGTGEIMVCQPWIDSAWCDANTLYFTDTCGVTGNYACPAGEVCSAEQQSCTPETVCAIDDDCMAADPCQVGSCEVGTGRCLYAPADDGVMCDDGNVDTVNDACKAGACVGDLTCVETVDCPDFFECLAGICEHITKSHCEVGCSEDIPCDNGLCTSYGDLQGERICWQHCSDVDPTCPAESTCVQFMEGLWACQPDVVAYSCDVDKLDGIDSCGVGRFIQACDPNTETCDAAQGICDLTNPCSIDDNCATLDACTIGSCNTDDGSCMYNPAAPGTPCDDNDPNTSNDQCDGIGGCFGQMTCVEDVDCAGGLVCVNGACEMQMLTHCEQGCPASPCEDRAFCLCIDAECTTGFCAQNCDLADPICPMGSSCVDVGGMGICEPDQQSSACLSSTEIELTNTCGITVTKVCEAPTVCGDDGQGGATCVAGP